MCSNGDGQISWVLGANSVVGGPACGWVPNDGSAMGGWVSYGWVGGGSGWVYEMQWVSGTVVGCVFHFCFCFYFSFLVVVI